VIILLHTLHKLAKNCCFTCPWLPAVPPCWKPSRSGWHPGTAPAAHSSTGCCEIRH